MKTTTTSSSRCRDTLNLRILAIARNLIDRPAMYTGDVDWGKRLPRFEGLK